MSKSERNFLTSFSFLSFLEMETSISVYYAPFQDVLKRMQEMDYKKQQHIIAICNNVLSDDNVVGDEPARVSAIRIIVALLPSSWPTIEKWLKIHPRKLHYEIQFTFFCYLDWAMELPTSSELLEKIVTSVSEYLKSVRYDTAKAAWMAGDLLGDHWQLEEAWPALSIVVTDAKYVVGRIAGLHGIEMILAKDNIGFIQGEIINLLHKVEKNDPSYKVRCMANTIQKQARVWRV